MHLQNAKLVRIVALAIFIDKFSYQKHA